MNNDVQYKLSWKPLEQLEKEDYLKVVRPLLARTFWISLNACPKPA